MQYSVAPRVKFQELGTKPQRKGHDAHAVEARDKKVPEFVNEDEDAKNEKKSQNCDHGIPSCAGRLWSGPAPL